jgi:hypothetical protein
MKLSRELFWDVNYETIDWEKNYQWVICRVLEYGSIKDWHGMRLYYGNDKIVDAALNARSLSIKTMHFIHNIFEVPLEKFRCYNSTLSDPIRWMY